MSLQMCVCVCKPHSRGDKEDIKKIIKRFWVACCWKFPVWQRKLYKITDDVEAKNHEQEGQKHKESFNVIMRIINIFSYPLN